MRAKKALESAVSGKAPGKLSGQRDFDRWARDAVLTDNPENLRLAVVELAARQLSARRGKGNAPPGELGKDLLNAGIVAGLAAIVGWRKGKFYKRIGGKIREGMRDHLKAGGWSEQNTWRGGYNKDARKFGSDGNAPSADLPGEDTEILERTDANAGTVAAIREVREATEGAAGATSHDGAHADDVRLNPRDDGEAGYGVAGATAGLNTGRVVPDVGVLVNLLELGRLADGDHAFVHAIMKAGGFDNYVSAGRKPNRGALAERLADIARKIERHRREIFGAGEAIEIEQTDGPRPAAAGPPGVPSIRSVVFELGLVDRDISRMRGHAWRPEVLPGMFFDVTIDGETWAQMQRALRWKRSRIQCGPLFREFPAPYGRSLLDL